MTKSSRGLSRTSAGTGSAPSALLPTPHLAQIRFELGLSIFFSPSSVVAVFGWPGSRPTRWNFASLVTTPGGLQGRERVSAPPKRKAHSEKKITDANNCIEGKWNK